MYEVFNQEAGEIPIKDLINLLLDKLEYGCKTVYLKVEDGHSGSNEFGGYEYTYNNAVLISDY